MRAIRDLPVQEAAPVLMEPLWRELTRRQASLAGPSQQDLFECWLYLPHLKPLHALFSVSKKFVTRCGTVHEGCGFSAESVDSINVWDVPLPPDGPIPADWWEGALSSQLAQVHMLPAWRCPCCGELGATQRVSDLTAPPCLWLQVHRFEAGPQGLRKLHRPFPIPIGGLRLAPLRHGETLRTVSYHLVGVVLHQGEFEGGHYRALAMRRHMWFSFDDSHTTCLGASIPPGLEHMVYGLLLLQDQPQTGLAGARGPLATAGRN